MQSYLHIHTQFIFAWPMDNCEFSYVASNGLPQQMHSRIDCICVVFLQSEFLYVASNYLPELMRSHIGCNRTFFLQSVFSNVFPNARHEHLQSHISCICALFVQLVQILYFCLNFQKRCSLWWQLFECLTSFCHVFLLFVVLELNFSFLLPQPKISVLSDIDNVMSHIIANRE